MQSVLMTRCSKSDLAGLLGVSALKVERWAAQGMPRASDGFYTLSQALRWILKGHRIDLGRKLFRGCVTQKELAELLALSRQALVKWGRAGLPRNRNGTYRLPDVLRWLRDFYRRQSEAEYQRQLQTMRKKLRRNIAQCERFLAGGKVEQWTNKLYFERDHNEFSERNDSGRKASNR